MVDNDYEDEDSDIATPYQKRKRSSTINYNLDAPQYDAAIRESPIQEPLTKRPKPAKGLRGCIIGVWRDSNLPNDEDKHAIYGFIDIHERLRTRIYAVNRRGEELIANIPTGAGGCWVTFPKIILDSHLKSLSVAQIKEYVRLRTDAKPEPTPEAQHEAEIQAVMKAISIAASDEHSSPVLKTSSSHSSLRGKSSAHRHSLPRQSLSQTPAFKAINASEIQTPKASPTSESKPNGILLGYWADSDAPNEADKHAVYGVLGGSDCFRVKVQRVTRDGRYVDGNFPIGAGALWLHYDKLVLDKHLAHLSRAEVKEYVRIRQRDIDEGESPRDRKANEQRAIKEAQEVVAAEAAGTSLPSKVDRSPVEQEVRHSSRNEQRMAAATKQAAEAEAAAEKLRKEKAAMREKQNEKARKEVAMAEAALQESAQQQLKNNLKKLNKVWVAQQTAFSNPPPPPSDEVKYYNGIKYERKQNGPFQGKLVSTPQIFSIDGEDYVEYRVLTKPSFF